ncbi:deoxyribodipyrimidine photo-lyase [Sulfurihydrogenibium azorense]|uniref:deoxyribodipyrimidine photo-lyase n=2 Tax=Sulfurihydrogenibium azorense TaxID=309806 RepID=UPI002409A1AB|nr:deoxyribodipyrimidine photo-lyase [Sulfurihydrogenibium azorense]MDM7274237.1 deoxyribodipyrimidine photo-lyase [Sulfurihydrogenibium azorense]
MFEERLEKLNNLPDNLSGKYILYSMEASLREDFNFSLEFAIQKANKLNKPLLVSFFITDKYKHSNQRYYKFVIEGILKTKKAIEERGIKFVIQKDDYVNGTLKLSKEAVCIVLDKNYLKTQRKWRENIAKASQVAVYQLENDVVVPIQVVSDKPIPYAYLYRDRLNKVIDRFLKPVEKIDLKVNSKDLDVESLEFKTPDEFLSILNIDKTVSTVDKYFVGGYDEAEKRLKEFIEKKLYKYKEFRSDPSKDYTSNLSPYLHFGQISPLKIVLEVLKHYDKNDENVVSFFNELIVWRELSRNFCWYNPLYNQYEGIPQWARQTLEEHKKDKRDYVYSLQEFEEAKTHDPYWNAAQKELLKTGKIHNYMRMYWAKKIIEWTEDPKQAFDIACYLNDKYALDGRDPNGYGGISWCFGTFDRPWQERKIFGKIRYMNDKGLERKFDVKAYLFKTDRS